MSAPQGFRERRYRAQDGLELYFRDYGDPLSTRTPALCLTGLTRNSRDFHHLALRLAPERRVLAPDYRGRGCSAYDPDWRNYDPRVYLNDILHLLAIANAERVVVFGTSLGGLLAMGLAAVQPTVLAGAVLNDVGPDVNPAGLSRILAYISEDRPQPDWAAAVAFLKTAMPNLSPTDDPVRWERLAEGTFRRLEDGLLHFDWDVALARPLRLPRPVPDLWPLFRALRHVRTLALRGVFSDVLSSDTFERMGVENPDLVRVTVPGVGHAPGLDEPVSREAIDGFLARL